MKKNIKDKVVVIAGVSGGLIKLKRRNCETPALKKTLILQKVIPSINEKDQMLCSLTFIGL